MKNWKCEVCGYVHSGADDREQRMVHLREGQIPEYHEFAEMFPRHALPQRERNRI